MHGCYAVALGKTSFCGCAQCFHDLLLDGGEIAGDALQFNSLSCIGPRLQAADAALQVCEQP